MSDYIVLGSNHHWFACWNWNEVIDLAKEMFEDGCSYVKVISNSQIEHWTASDINIIK